MSLITATKTKTKYILNGSTFLQEINLLVPVIIDGTVIIDGNEYRVVMTEDEFEEEIEHSRGEWPTVYKTIERTVHCVKKLY